MYSSVLIFFSDILSVHTVSKSTNIFLGFMRDPQ
jgi:hypothetical protein